MKTHTLLAAVDHYAGRKHIHDLTQKITPLTESDVRDIHRVMCFEYPHAGEYTDVDLCVSTENGLYYFPLHGEIPALMRDFATWLGTVPNTPEAAFEAHRRLVNIHPFGDGNGRTARFLVNIILIRGGFPPIYIRRPEDRDTYLDAVQEARESEQGIQNFNNLLYERLDAALRDERAALHG